MIPSNWGSGQESAPAESHSGVGEPVHDAQKTVTCASVESVSVSAIKSGVWARKREQSQQFSPIGIVLALVAQPMTGSSGVP